MSLGKPANSVKNELIFQLDFTFPINRRAGKSHPFARGFDFAPSLPQR